MVESWKQSSNAIWDSSFKEYNRHLHLDSQFGNGCLPCIICELLPGIPQQETCPQFQEETHWIFPPKIFERNDFLSVGQSWQQSYQPWSKVDCRYWKVGKLSIYYLLQFHKTHIGYHPVFEEVVRVGRLERTLIGGTLVLDLRLYHQAHLPTLW